MVSGQAAYVEELWQHLPYDASLYADIVHRFKADPQRQVHTANCKKFLLAISDKFIAYAKSPLCIPSTLPAMASTCLLAGSIWRASWASTTCCTS
jgi:hypothetical protein